MALIFWLSAQPNLDSGLGLIDDIGRKVVHAVAYCGLTLLWFWALRPVTPRAVVAAIAIALVYAITDEYHQGFVEGRDGSPADIGIDLVGVIVASMLLRYDPRVRSVLDGEEP